MAVTKYMNKKLNLVTDIGYILYKSKIICISNVCDMIALYYGHYFDRHCLYFENVSNGCDYCVVSEMSHDEMILTSNSLSYSKWTDVTI